MSQNFRLFHVSNLSVRNFRIFLLMYPGSKGHFSPASLVVLTVENPLIAPHSADLIYEFIVEGFVSGRELYPASRHIPLDYSLFLTSALDRVFL